MIDVAYSDFAKADVKRLKRPRSVYCTVFGFAWHGAVPPQVILAMILLAVARPVPPQLSYGRFLAEVTHGSELKTA